MNEPLNVVYTVASICGHVEWMECLIMFWCWCVDTPPLPVHPSRTWGWPEHQNLRTRHLSNMSLMNFTPWGCHFHNWRIFGEIVIRSTVICQLSRLITGGWWSDCPKQEFFFIWFLGSLGLLLGPWWFEVLSCLCQLKQTLKMTKS